MPPLRKCYVLIVLLMMTTGDVLAGGFQLNECGARAMAQAGAFAARASDGSAIFYNPAGLGFQNHPEVYAGATIITPTASFYGPVQSNTNTQYKQKNDLFTPINIYASYPLMDQLVVGVGVNNPFGLGTEWPADWPGRYLSVHADLKSFFFSPTVSYRLSDNLSVGVGANFATGNLKLQRAVAVASVAVPTEPLLTLDISGTGWGANAGILYRPSPKLSFGLSYRTEIPLTATGSASFSPNYAALGLPQGDASIKITLPGTGFFGVAYKPMERLEVEADVQYIQWSTYDTLAVEFSPSGVRSASPKVYQNTYILRFGGEYTMDALHLRAGYLYDHSPVKSEYVEPILPDADRNGFNLGFGYDLSPRFSIDVAYLFLKFSERNVTNSIPENSFDGTYHTYANLFAVNFGYTL